MKINEVEAMTHIPKKNIRYYEAEGLLHPARDSGNGYRNYSQEDVETLRKIRVWRKLDLPVDEIRRILTGALTVPEALERQKIALAHQRSDLETRQLLCQRLIETVAQGQDMDTEALLQEMARLEGQGVRFHDFTRQDHKKKVRTVWIAAVCFALVMVAFAALIWWAYSVDPIPWWAITLLETLILAPAVGVFISGRARIQEIQGGEEDDLGNY